MSDAADGCSSFGDSRSSAASGTWSSSCCLGRKDLNRRKDFQGRRLIEKAHRRVAPHLVPLCAMLRGCDVARVRYCEVLREVITLLSGTFHLFVASKAEDKVV
jgi:hypothetical protein